MPRQKQRRNKRVRNLMVITTLSAILLSISTYAWFIGMRTVNVSAFDVEIASTKGLLLSLNGERWSETINIAEDILDQVSYEEHTNSWGGSGLVPVSTIGDMDLEASRMKLFEKASLTATPGGYRLLASRVDNTGAEEKDGYVVFDLFIKNYTGDQYIEDLNELDEEAIYLTVDSEVKVADGGVKNTGIENSVRVAFSQIGRVHGETDDVDKITGITCATNEEGELAVVDGVTGICRKAQIWEPNDTKHVQGAINWYDRSCKKRISSGISTSSYEGECGTIEEGQSYPTYAVKDIIQSEHEVDIYDGEAFNGYDGSSDYLEAYDYFTDTMKLKEGTERPEFMYLAPNSITKVRVYIYIEGQDIDNYDFAQIGKRISVKFGFTKQRFNPGETSPEDEINLEKPTIKLNGDERMVLAYGEDFEDPGVEEAKDASGKDLTDRVETYTPIEIDTNEPNTYIIYYRVTDDANNQNEVVRTVVVQPETTP